MATKRSERPSDTEWLNLDVDLKIAASLAVLWEIRDLLEDIAEAQAVIAGSTR